jgi:hypothetical protein
VTQFGKHNCLLGSEIGVLCENSSGKTAGANRHCFEISQDRSCRYCRSEYADAWLEVPRQDQIREMFGQEQESERPRTGVLGLQTHWSLER